MSLYIDAFIKAIIEVALIFFAAFVTFWIFNSVLGWPVSLLGQLLGVLFGWMFGHYLNA